ncbi:hypothetical protein [Actinomadura sp. 9N407]|uniref:hypothetical protein n=1 Tax=Actinomadura sp. 9N407 TaxID=3375154 RepID=UPI0037A3611B
MTTIFASGRLCEEATELAFEYAPRRFALCWVDFDEDDGGILCWGLQLATDTATICSESGRTLGRFSSAEDARRFFARKEEVLLIWLDEEAQTDERRPAR